MALQGTLKKWNPDRGFGFIAPTGGGHELFVHISAFPRDDGPPRIGEALLYVFGRGDDGKPRAVRAWRPGSTRAEPGRRDDARPGRGHRRTPVGLLVAIVLVILAVGYGYLEQAADRQQARAAVDLPGRAASSAGSTPFRCDGRLHCSQMTSCKEATYFLKTCPGTRMDGDGDGIPCEQQWCTGPLAR